MARAPMNPETRAAARALFYADVARNEIARQLDLDPATVTRWARSEGLEFDRSATDAATKAHTIDLAAVRLSLVEKMAIAAENMLDAIDDEYLVFNFGGKDNTYEEHLLTSAPVEIKRSIIVTAGIAFDKLTRIVEKDNGGLEQTVGVLDALAGNLHAAAAMLREQNAETVATGEPDEA